ncbi:MAG: RagB/SusD family nutrient uptake outer membrane protein [Flavisolibacter sp.]
MKHMLLYCLMLAGILSTAGCKKYVDVPPPENQLISSVAFSDDNTANATVAGLYSNLNAYNYQFANFLGSAMPAFGADEFKYAFSSTGFNEFRDDNLTPGNSYIRSLWSPVYASIYQANAIIEGLTRSTAVSEAAKKQYMGEAKFLRAFFYFYLVNYFGDVPLILNTDYKTNTVLPRTKAEEVYASILADLKDAQSDLSDNYLSPERTRVNKAAATALLARTYLYRQQWDLAEQEASKVIANGQYELLADLNKVFLKGSREAIWQIQTVNKSTAGVNTWEGFNMVPASAAARAYYYVYDSFLSAFEAGDNRRNAWIHIDPNVTGTFYYPYKYKIRTGTPVQEYTMPLRFAEQYLIRAEARAQQNNLAGAKADLDTIRHRAGLPSLDDNLSKEQLLLAVEQERRIELFAEWGHRWFDLRRTGRALTVLAPLKPDLTATDLWYPLPLEAIKTNPFLVQNDGY